MDERIRRLERRAATGDYYAEQELAGIMMRFYRSEWLSARDSLQDNPESMEAWARYMAAARQVKENPSLGRPYYRLLRKDIVNLLYDTSRSYHHGEDSPHDIEGRLDTELMRTQGFEIAQDSNTYVTITHPMHPSDREKYGFVISMISRARSVEPYRLYARIRRDGNITYWATDLSFVRAIVVERDTAANTFTSASELLFFLYQVIYSAPE